MSEQLPNQNIEAANQLPPDVEEFQSNAGDLLADFSVEHVYGLRTAEGAVSKDSIRTATANVAKAAAEDPSVLGLVQAVNEQTRAHLADSESAQKYMPVSQRPEFALLKLFGAARKVERKPSVIASPEDEHKTEETARKIGHQLLVDGHMVQGLMVPGRNEVMTSKGILRTRSTPRNSNR